jgi:hypothetical protein
MDFRSTVDTVDTDSTLVGSLPKKARKHEPFRKEPVHDLDEGRFYGPLRYDTMKRAGPKDSKNTRLTVPMRLVHTLRHANLNNRNPGDRIRHMGLRAYEDHRRVRGATGRYEGNAIFGDEMKNVITQLDVTSSVNGIEIEDFQHGGTKVGDVRGTMIGAGVSVPTDDLDATDLNSAYGLHYAIEIKPGNAIKNMQKRGMMRGIERQKETPAIPRAKPYAS